MRLSRLYIRQRREAPEAPGAAGDFQLLVRTLRSAAEALTPVAIDPGPQFPRVSTFVEAVDDDVSGRAALVLRPVSPEAIPAVASSRVTVRSCDPAEPWMITAGRLQACGARAARLDLGDAVLAPLAARALARTEGHGHEPLVLSLPSGTEDLDGCVFPLRGLGASHCIVDTAVPLAPGRRFDPVELYGSRRILRQAAATVLETIPWIEHDGSRRFRCRLLLEPSEGGAVAPHAYDLVSHRARIERILELACMLTTAAWLEAPGWPRAAARLEAVSPERLTVRMEQALPDTIPLPVHVHLGCELFAVSYQIQVRPLRRRGALLELTLPLVMRRQRRRREQRARVPPSLDVWVTFRSPATGIEARRRVRDISLGGLCFEADPAVDVVWPGLRLEKAWIAMPGRTVEGGELEVRGVEAAPDGTLVCHTASHAVDRGSETTLGGLLGALKHPGVEMHDGSGFRAVLGLYRRAGLLADFIERNLEPVLPVAARAWQRLHQGADPVGCTFLCRNEGGPRASFSGVRCWDRTWLAQHFAAFGAGSGLESGAVHLAYFDYVLSRPDAHYLAFFVKADNSAMNAFQQRFLELTGTPECVGRTTVEFFRCGQHLPALRPRTPGTTIAPLDARGERLVSRAAERSLGGLAARALSLVEGGFALADTAERFRAVGLERRREAHMVSVAGRPALGVLHEVTSPGVNLTWMLNAWWLLPVRESVASEIALRAALEARVLRSPPPSPAGDRFVIVPADAPTQALADAGFESLGRVNLFVFHRSGIHRYYQHIADRYGEVGARAARRDSLRRRAAR